MIIIKTGFHKAWNNKKNENFDQRKKWFNPPHFINHPRKPPQGVTNIAMMIGEKPREEREKREPLQCWGCGEDHFIRNFPHGNGSAKQVHNIQQDETISKVARNVPRIYVAQKEH